MYILFDTNIWYDQLGFTTKNGAAVRFFLHHRNATIAIPEVVHLELVHNLARRLKKAKHDIQTNHSTLLSVFGSLTELKLPTGEEIETRVAALLSERDVPHILIPFSLTAARSSLERIAAQRSPSRGKSQFVDGVIWENCMDLLKKTDVCLVTNDSAFYEAKAGKTIASDLADELNQFEHSLKLFRNLDDLLAEIRRDVIIDESVVRDCVFGDEENEIGEILTSTGFQLAGAPDTEIKAYITEIATQLNFSFEILQPCEDASPQGREPAAMTIIGEGFFGANTNVIDRLRVSRIRLRYRDVDGEMKNKGSVRVNADPVWIGSKRLQHSLKIPLDPTDGG